MHWLLPRGAAWSSGFLRARRPVLGLARPLETPDPSFSRAAAFWRSARRTSSPGLLGAAWPAVRPSPFIALYDAPGRAQPTVVPLPVCRNARLPQVVLRRLRCSAHTAARVPCLPGGAAQPLFYCTNCKSHTLPGRPLCSPRRLQWQTKRSAAAPPTAAPRTKSRRYHTSQS